MTSFPNRVGDTKPIPGDVLGETSLQDIRKLADQGYEVHVGLTSEFAQAISVMSEEPSIREYCPRDSLERFADLEATEHWLSKGRAVFLLLKRAENDDLQLAGYGWVGTASSPYVPEGETTLALRVGEAGQGQGLATPFARLMMLSTAALYGAKNMWLETWASNGGAVHIYHKIGFVTVAERPDERLLPNGETMADTRLYMSLPKDLLPPAS